MYICTCTCTVYTYVHVHVQCVMYSPTLLMEGVYAFLGQSVPQPHCLVVAAGHQQPGIGGEPGTPHPVGVGTQTELELLPVNSPHLQSTEDDSPVSNLNKDIFYKNTMS